MHDHIATHYYTSCTSESWHEISVLAIYATVLNVVYKHVIYIKNLSTHILWTKMG